MHIVYETKNLINDKIYIGVHKQVGLEFDGYFGSGSALMQAIKKYGTNNFKRSILFIYDGDDEYANKELAYAKEAEIVTDEFILLESNYNMKPGGFGGWPDMTGISKPDGYGIGEKNPMYGRKQSEESNEKNRQWHLNKPYPSEETRAKWSQYKGDKSSTFIGYWVLPNGKQYGSLKEASNDTGLPTRTIARYCKEYSHKIIQNKSYTDNQYLKSLGSRDDIIGKTFHQLGFLFIPKTDDPAVCQVN